jgi:hypothetical protein
MISMTDENCFERQSAKHHSLGASSTHVSPISSIIKLIMMHIFRTTMKDSNFIYVICDIFRLFIEDSSVCEHYQTIRKIPILMLLHFDVGGSNNSIKESGGYKISLAS